MNRLLYAAVADDDTGASDLAGMFADQGVPVVLVLDATSAADVERWTAGAAGVVFATATRAMAPASAYAKTAEAVRTALTLEPRTVQIKYCSTFDSSPEGNIGPSLDAALEATGERFTIALPALPVNGRTTYCGYHFVKGRLLSDSPMRHHPLTPMTESDLVAWLGRQTRRPVNLTPWSVVERGSDSIAEHWATLGEGISILDCLNDPHAAAIAEAACGLRVISGGSAFGTHLPAAWRRRGWWTQAASDALAGRRFADGRGQLIVAGSCSVATRGQNAWAEANGAVVHTAGTAALIAGSFDPAPLVEALAAGHCVLLRTAPEIERGSELRIAEALAALACNIVRRRRPEILISAGGETSSALCRALGVRALAVGRNIQPGVPLCLPLDGEPLPVVLKSGNFGSEDFYGAAIKARRR